MASIWLDFFQPHKGASAMPIAAAYIRVSTEDQTEYSPAAQLEEILAFARKNGFSVPDEFVFALF